MCVHIYIKFCTKEINVEYYIQLCIAYSFHLLDQIFWLCTSYKMFDNPSYVF